MPCSAGFTYIGLLMLIAILGITAAATLQVGSLLQRRAAEYELLAVGLEFQAALASYADATPVGQSPVPASLNDLLEDARFPEVRRHLRRVSMDPITSRFEWGLMTSATGQGIIGMYSLSEAQPIKVGNFPPPFEHLKNKSRYRDWVFGPAHAAYPAGIPQMPAS